MSQEPQAGDRSDPREEATRETRQSRTESAAGQEAGYENRILRRSKEDRVIAGICGGLGRYLEVDPVLFRIAFILSLLAGGIGLLIYIVLWIAVPEYPSRDVEAQSLSGHAVDTGRTGVYVGGLFVLVGALILLRELFPWFDTSVIAALVLIGIGAAIVIRGIRRG